MQETAFSDPLVFGQWLPAITDPGTELIHDDVAIHRNGAHLRTVHVVFPTSFIRWAWMTYGKAAVLADHPDAAMSVSVSLAGDRKTAILVLRAGGHEVPVLRFTHSTAPPWLASYLVSSRKKM